MKTLLKQLPVSMMRQLRLHRPRLFFLKLGKYFHISAAPLTRWPIDQTQAFHQIMPCLREQQEMLHLGKRCIPGMAFARPFAAIIRQAVCNRKITDLVVLTLIDCCPL